MIGLGVGVGVGVGAGGRGRVRVRPRRLQPYSEVGKPAQHALEPLLRLGALEVRG